MNNTLSKLLVFTIGAAVGSIVTWKLVVSKYEQIANDEIESIREYYANRETNKITDEEYGKNEYEEYHDIISDKGYHRDSNNSSNKKEDNKMVVDTKPYVISARDFDESDYARETLEYFEGDDILVDGYGDVIEDVEEKVGEDFASHFGENKDDPDTVYIRDDEAEMVYEICRDYGKYSEVY